MKSLIAVCLLFVASNVFAQNLQWHKDSDGTKDMGLWDGDKFIGRWFEKDQTFREWDGKKYVDGALVEVNLARRQRGLRPFIYDANLTIAATTCANLRATQLIAGHTSNDFAALPSGCNAQASGCGALEPSWGWGTCCTYENYTYAGAALRIGRDGRRYMHLFVR